MLHDIEDKVMEAPSILCGGSSCRPRFASSVRVMKPGSNIRHLHWLQILLVILLTGQASSNENSEAPLPPTSPVTAPQTSVQYLLNVTVEVTGLKTNETEIMVVLMGILEKDLERCLSSDSQTTTTTPVSPQNTSSSTSNNTEATTAFQNYTTTIITTATTTTAATTTTTAATTTPTTTTTDTTTTPTTTTAATTTTPTTTTSATTTTPTANTTAATTVTMLTSSNTTTATIDQSTTTTSGQSISSTTSSPNTVTTTSTVNEGSTAKTKPNPPGQGNNNRAARAVIDNVAQTRGINLFQELTISCATSTSIKNTECSVRLKLNQRVSACCILRTLCASSNSSPYIKVVGKTARLDQQRNECNSSIEDSCAYKGPAGTPCQSGENMFVQLDEQCELPPTTTPSPNVTTTQPNTTTTTPANETSPLNTTVAATTNQSVSASAESQAYGLLELTRNVSKLNSSQVDQLVSQLESLLSGPNVSVVLGNISIHIVSNLLGASNETLASSSKRIIGIVDTVGLKLVLNKNTENLLAPDMALSVKPVDGSNFQKTIFSISDPNSVQVSGDAGLRRSVKTGSSIPQGSIQLPQSLTHGLNPEEQKLASRVQFNFYQKSTVFQDNSLGRNKLNSGIISASVANLTIKNLTDKVVINLRNMYPITANYQAACAFWDFALNNQSGGWSTDGCVVQNQTDNETICGCNHLTSFAILLDLSKEHLTSREQATILTFISYIGCGISSIFLSFTLLTYLLFEKLRRDIPSKILIHLCFALLLLNLVFLVDSWLALYTDTLGLCISTAWFLHYFLLVAFTWMGLGAVHMYLALVKVFNSYVPRYILKFSLVGWGIPMIVVIIVIAIKKENYGPVSYGKFTDGTSDTFCWLTNDIVFYVAVAAYFCVIFLFNLIMFIVVLVQVCRIKSQSRQNLQSRTILQDVRSVAGITVLLGLTWGFAFFAWGSLNLPFMYLFSIFNSLQGFFIFLFHCLVKENVRRQWRIYLCCGRMRLAENSQWSRTATQKTVKKISTSHSSQSGSSSSSTAFLASDSSAPANGTGNPLGERVITADEEGYTDVILNELNSQSRNQQAPS